MQHPLFLTTASLCLVIQGSPGIVEIHVEACDPLCMNLMTVDLCLMRCCVIAASRIAFLTKLVLINHCDGLSLWTLLSCKDLCNQFLGDLDYCSALQ